MFQLLLLLLILFGSYSVLTALHFALPAHSLSRSIRFARCFKTSMGLAPHQYVIARRMELAKRLVLTTKLTIAEIAWAIGYQNIGHFRRLFSAHIGVTP